MNEIRISPFLLERYHIGEITNEEKHFVEEALAGNEPLAAALADLDRADNDFYRRFPREKFFPAGQDSRPSQRRSRRKTRPFVWVICAAALVMVVALPMLLFMNPRRAEFGERMKGANVDSNSIELSIYLRGNSLGEVIKLTDQAGIHEGNTIQLVYRVPGTDSAEKYGVIFSIDGRSYVTMHYPVTPWQSTLLVSGRSVPLDEAFILDDAPGYEIFFFVAGDAPIDVRSILATARQLAAQIGGNPQEAINKATIAFGGYELMVFTLLKE